MSDKNSSNSWRIPLTIIAVFVGLWIYNKVDKISGSAGGAKFEAEKTIPEKNEPTRFPEKTTYQIDGEYDMVFDFKRCQNPDLAMSKLKTYYEVRLNQDNLTVKGTGHKIAEADNEKRTNYRKKFPIWFEGKILGDTLILNVSENNSNKEVSGIAKFPLKNIHSRFTGIFYASGDNCDGDITLSRQDRK